MCLARRQLKQSVHALKWDALGFRDKEEDEDDGEEHQGCEEEVDAESHRGEHLRSEASDYLLLAIANPKSE